MKRILTIGVMIFALLLGSTAFADWYLSSNTDATDATGRAVMIAPGISGYQFVLDQVFMDDANVGATDQKFTFAREVSGGPYTGGAAGSTTQTDLTIANTGSSAVLAAGDVLYGFSGGTSDPNDGTLVFYGVVSSTALSDTANTETAACDENLVTAVTTTSSIYAARPFHVVTEVVEATDHDVMFGPSVQASYDTTAKLQGFTLNVVGRVGMDTVFMVDGATVPTVFDINIDGHYESYR